MLRPERSGVIKKWLLVVAPLKKGATAWIGGNTGFFNEQLSTQEFIQKFRLSFSTCSQGLLIDSLHRER